MYGNVCLTSHTDEDDVFYVQLYMLLVVLLSTLLLLINTCLVTFFC